MMSRPKKQKQVKTIYERLKVIEEVERNPEEKRKHIAKRLGIAISTLNSIFARKDRVREHIESCGSSSKKRKIKRDSTFAAIENVLVEWYHQARASNTPINGNILKDEAKKIAARLNITHFTASNGWISRFKDRHGLVYKQSALTALNNETKEGWLEKLPNLLDGYKPRDIYNADETGLFFNILPDNTMAMKKHRSEHRLTIFLCVNSDGSDKQNPIVIGKSSNPRCFANIKKLPTKYYANSKAWLTTDIFSLILQSLNATMAAQDRKILLFVDNCAAHAVDTSFLTNVKVIRYPATSTGVVQPLNCIIKYFKQLYRKHYVQTTVCRMDAGKDRMKKIDILEAMHYIVAAWWQVTPQTIQDCFRKAGLRIGQPPLDISNHLTMEEKEKDEAFRNDWQKFSGMDNEKFNEYVSVDNDLATSELCEVQVGAWLEPEAVDEDDTEFEPKLVPDFAETYDALMKVKVFFYAHNNSDSDCDSVLSLERSFFELRRKALTDQMTTAKCFVKQEPPE